MYNRRLDFKRKKIRYLIRALVRQFVGSGQFLRIAIFEPAQKDIKNLQVVSLLLFSLKNKR